MQLLEHDVVRGPVVPTVAGSGQRLFAVHLLARADNAGRRRRQTNIIRALKSLSSVNFKLYFVIYQKKYHYFLCKYIYTYIFLFTSTKYLFLYDFGDVRNAVV